ncbi:hypothetical protein LCGC14_2904820, partial [marine sediment metagenome]
APTLVRPLAPIIDEPATAFFITGAAQNSRVRLTVASPGLTSNLVIFCHIIGQGRNVWTSRFSAIMIDVPNAGRQVFFQPELEAIFGTLVLGQRMFIVVNTQDAHGQRGPVDTHFDDARP